MRLLVIQAECLHARLPSDPQDQRLKFMTISVILGALRCLIAKTWAPEVYSAVQDMQVRPQP